MWFLSHFSLFFSERLLYVWETLHSSEELLCSQNSSFWQSVLLGVIFAEIKLVGSKEDRDHASLLLCCGTSLAVAGTFGLWLVHAQFLSLSFCASTVPDMGRVQPFPIPLHRVIHNDISNDRISATKYLTWKGPTRIIWSLFFTGTLSFFRSKRYILCYVCLCWILNTNMFALTMKAKRQSCH